MKRQISIILISFCSVFAIYAQEIYSGDKVKAVFIQSSNGNYNENLRLFPSTTNDYSSIILGAVPGNFGTGIGQWSIVRYPSANNYLFGIRYNSTDHLNITNTGNIGIGTNPLGKLHIDAGANTGIDGKVLIRSSSADHGQFQILNPTGNEASMCFIGSGTTFGTTPQSNSGNSYIWSLGSDLWGNGGNVFGIGNAEYNGQIFFVKSNGTVGIGTSNTYGARLHIDKSVIGGIGGSVFITNTAQATVGNKTRLGFDLIGFDDNTSTASVDAVLSNTNGATDLLFNVYDGSGSVANYERMRILGNNGNVGIGTTNPAYKLDVLGTIRAKEVLVNLDGGADFVFEKDYKLLPIEHVANYVQENKHLPDIPSANEMVKNGVSMGDMQVKLLQKIEEQTLYIIELNKQVQTLKKQLEELRDK